MLDETDRKFLQLAYDEAKAGFDEGGCPIGSVLARGESLVSSGRNQRVQKGDPIAHGEMVHFARQVVRKLIVIRLCIPV